MATSWLQVRLLDESQGKVILFALALASIRASQKMLCPMDCMWKIEYFQEKIFLTFYLEFFELMKI
jgi:hypothetical protein